MNIFKAKEISSSWLILWYFKIHLKRYIRGEHCHISPEVNIFHWTLNDQLWLSLRIPSASLNASNYNTPQCILCHHIYMSNILIFDIFVNWNDCRFPMYVNDVRMNLEKYNTTILMTGNTATEMKLKYKDKKYRFWKYMGTWTAMLAVSNLFMKIKHCSSCPHVFIFQKWNLFIKCVSLPSLWKTV